MRTSSELTDELAGNEGRSSSATPITGWLAVLPMSVRVSVAPRDTVTVTLQRLPGEPTVEPSARPSGYREHAGHVSIPSSKTLEELAVCLGRHGYRFRRQKMRLVPRWLERIRVVVTAEDPANAGVELHLTGDVEGVARVCEVMLAELGACVLGIEELMVRVDETTTKAEIRRELRAQLDGRTGPVPCGP